MDAHWAGWSPGGGGAGQGGARVDTHLPQGAGQTAELVGRVDGHHTHGGRGDGPAQGIGPLGEGVGSVVRGPESHDAHHDHKLKVRAELKLQLPAGRPGGPGARVSRGGSPGQGGSGVRALQTAPLRVGALTCRSARAGVGWGGGCVPPHPWWPCLAHALRVTVSRRPPPAAHRAPATSALGAPPPWSGGRCRPGQSAASGCLGAARGETLSVLAAGLPLPPVSLPLRLWLWLWLSLYLSVSVSLCLRLSLATGWPRMARLNRQQLQTRRRGPSGRAEGRGVRMLVPVSSSDLDRPRTASRGHLSRCSGPPGLGPRLLRSAVKEAAGDDPY